jgi:hypothetical protein
VENGLAVVRDRDEFFVAGGGSRFFSTETLARVEAFPGSAHPLFCPRCKQLVESQAPAVRCPQCRVWHHQAEELSCWTYAPTCGACPQLTDLAAGFQWTPLEL